MKMASRDRRIDILVNNAGLGAHWEFADGQNWPREVTSINVNIVALSYLMKQAIPHMQGQAAGGS